MGYLDDIDYDYFAKWAEDSMLSGVATPIISQALVEIICYTKDRDFAEFMNNWLHNVPQEYEIRLKNRFNLAFNQHAGIKALLIDTLLDQVYNDLQYTAGILTTIVTSTLDYTPVYLHLFALCACYHSYFSTVYDQILNDSFSSLKELNQIFHILIENYSKYKFYYTFNDTRLIKIEFVQDKRYGISHKKTEYEIINKLRATYLRDKATGYEFNLHKNLKYITTANKEKIGFKYFKSVNENICRILRFKQSPCTWCYPDINHLKAKKLCSNCQKLHDELENIKYPVDEKESNTDLEKIDFNKEILKVKLKDVKNLYELRRKRKTVLLELLRGFQIKKSTKTLINKCFDTPDVIKN